MLIIGTEYTSLKKVIGIYVMVLYDGYKMYLKVQLTYLIILIFEILFVQANVINF